MADFHCWRAAQVIRAYVHQLRTNLDDIFIWMDVVCINQHGERTGSDIAAVRDVIQV